MLKNILLFLIKIYQKTISPDHGLLKNFYPFQACRFYPSCSQYTYEALQKYSFMKGFFMGLKRVVRCHPFNEGGYDPPFNKNLKI